MYCINIERFSFGKKYFKERKLKIKYYFLLLEIQNIKSQYVNTEGMELPHHHQPHNNFHQQQQSHQATTATTGNPTRSGRPRDPFDMSPFALNPPGGGIPSPSSLASGGFGLPSPTGTGAGMGNLPSPLGPNSNSSNNSTMKSQLNKEPWFHGPISRYKLIFLKFLSASVCLYA